ncbi:phage regulatory CII family protein [Desulfoluna butyratoxydans]|uniref:Uncharacterized protein n=1 Tax=Desulfoluna butyratoxydans TaxID=231438 RepID=A0A4U8YLP5_9BACT|nr:phage regulatory CII family protein [Desulfoluna butyratoxydans]VFQ44364.1 hypothetical protein MSL71_20130 [Desulfoluna butyratoxydans]
MIPDTALAKMNIGSVMELAVSVSGKTRADLQNDLKWTRSRVTRICNPNAHYWPSLPDVPFFCNALGNTILIDWLAASCDESAKASLDAASKDDTKEVLRLMNSIGKEMGDVHEAIQKALSNDGEVDDVEARRIAREGYDVIRRWTEMFSTLARIQGI